MATKEEETGIENSVIKVLVASEIIDKGPFNRYGEPNHALLGKPPV
jgi:hypothetical protein